VAEPGHPRGSRGRGSDRGRSRRAPAVPSPEREMPPAPGRHPAPRPVRQASRSRRVDRITPSLTDALPAKRIIDGLMCGITLPGSGIGLFQEDRIGPATWQDRICGRRDGGL